MDRPAGQLILVSFASDAYRDWLAETVRRLGYEPYVLQGEKWLLAEPDRFDRPTILLLSHNHYPPDKLLSVLIKRQTVPILGAFTCDDARWGEEILSRCSDFLGWPCHKDELKLRLQRVFGGAELGASNIDEISLLEEFVNFNMLGSSPAFLEAIRLARKFARCEAPVLIEGETGTGKDLASRAIHYLSARRDYPFIPVNCGAIPDNLIENELFGHEKGAFTDAKESQLGIVAQARGGTLFLDEADTLSPKAQIALLRFLEHQEYRPLGSRRTSKTDVRIITATNASLDRLTAKGLFRQELLFRLNVLFVRLPALRERGSDIRLLAEHFIREYSARYNQPARFLHPHTLAWMMTYRWPGNVRELENLLHRECLLAEESVIWIRDKTVTADSLPNPTAAEHISQDMKFSEAKANTIAAFEKSYLYWLMAETHGNISLAARRAGKQRSALRKLLHKHGIERTAWSTSS